MARKEQILEPLVDTNQVWDTGTAAYSGQDIENFIKSQLDSKFGEIYFDDSVEEEVTAYFFRSLVEKNLWLESRNPEYVLKFQTFSVRRKSTRYTAQLLFERDTDYPIISINNEIALKYRYHSLLVTDDEKENVNIDGKLVIEQRMKGETEWNTITTISKMLKSKNPDSVQWDNDLDLSSIIKEGNQEIRLHVEYTVTEASGIKTNVVSSSKVFNIIRTTLSVEMANSPQMAVNHDCNFVLEYFLSGIVDRKLYIKITGQNDSKTFIYNVSANEYTNNTSIWSKEILFSNDIEGILTHGVRTFEAWMTCSDGITEESIETPHVVNQLMYVVDNNDSTPYLLIQNLATIVKNYVQSDLCSYTLFVPNHSKVEKEVVFKLTDYSSTTDYFRMEDIASTGTIKNIATSVEIEDATEDTAYAYFGVYDKETNTLLIDNVKTITVDNKDKFMPTSGADFILNPKTRNNTESNPFTIVNTVNNKTIPSEWTNFSGLTDTWIEDDSNQKVLRVLAGQKLSFDYDWLSGFSINNAAQVTLELDFKVDNITDENEPIFSASELGGTGGFVGLQIKPLEGLVYTKTNYVRLMQNFSIEEGTRVHIAVNIISNYRVKPDSKKLLSICRVFINGVIEREFLFDPSKEEWFINGSKITIGHEHADIDIYSLRVFKKGLNAQEVLNDYTATLPTSEEKLAFRTSNSILDNNREVNVTEVQKQGKNILIWHGIVPTHANQSKQKGWYEIKQFDKYGILIPELSGTLCKETASLVGSGQGTTAKTYYEWNLQTKLKDVEMLIWIPLEQLHSDIVQGDFVIEEDKTFIKLRGCGLGKNDWAGSESIRSGGFEKYEVLDDLVGVPDGWIDGNGMYRGKSYMLSNRYGQKLCIKINYASSMQSHLIGGNNGYNDLHTLVVGKQGMQVYNENVRLCKEQKPFYFFEETEGVTSFKGLGTFGPAKMDDASMGFDKKETPNFCMIEGSDNNLVLTDFRTPWIDNNITYEIEDGEVAGFQFNEKTSFDLDKCATVKVNGIKQPNEFVLGKIKELVNWVYSYSTRIKCFVGAYREFLLSNPDTTYKYWCTSGEDAYYLYRYDEVQKTWVDAGWDPETNLVKRLSLSVKYPIPSNISGQWSKVNDYFILKTATYAKQTISDIFIEDSLKFHYVFVNTLLAGTDNCSKNTYYILVPCSDGKYRWMLVQDDVDTIFKTDNSGYQNKPYYIDRLHKYADYDTTQTSLYQGDANVLFDLCESMWEDDRSLTSMMFEIFKGMCTLSGTVMNFFEEYFFSVQKYFCENAYNETARIRYEYPESIDYVSEGRGVHPIAQSIGRQLLSERQYIKQRLILFASYCSFGEFGKKSGANEGGSIGIADANTAFTFQGNGTTQKVEFTGIYVHQYMYLNGFYGQTTKHSLERCSPGRSYTFKITDELTGDTSCGLCGGDYFREIGNIGGLQVKRDQPFQMSGKRLQNITITPINGIGAFAPEKVTFNTPLIETFNINGMNGIIGNIDLTKSIRLRSIDCKGTSISSIQLPKNKLLSDLRLNDKLETLNLIDLPQLEVCLLDGVDYITSITVKNCPLFDSKVNANKLYRVNNPALKTINFYDINWRSVDKDLLLWLADKNAVLTGTAVLIKSQTEGTIKRVELEDKIKFAAAWGNIDSTSNKLYIDYLVANVNQHIESISICGNQYMKPGTYTQKLISTPAYGNDIAIENNKIAISWTLPRSIEDIATIDSSGTITVHQEDESHNMYTLTCTVKKTDGTILTTTKQVGFWNRIPEVGDFAWGDGTYGTSWEENKDFMGLVFMKERLPKDKTKPQTGWDIRVVHHRQLVCGNQTSFNNGLYIGNTSSNNTWSESELVDCAAAIGQLPIEIGNIKGLQHKGGGGTVNDNSYLDDTTEDGYKVIVNNDCWNDYDGKNNTAKTVAYANSIIDSYLSVSENIPEFLRRGRPVSLSDLGDIITSAMSYQYNGTVNQEKSWKYLQYLYLIDYVAYLFEPAHKQDLDDRYKMNQWYLPAQGELNRIYNFWRFGQSLDKANETPLTIARTPIFANANLRGASININWGWYWSSTSISRNDGWNVGSSGRSFNNDHYNRTTGFAVSAYTFNL